MVARIVSIVLLMAFSVIASADEQATYAPGKVVYDFSSPDPQVLAHLLDRASLLQNLYGNNPFDASIIIVVHEGAVPLFASANQDAHADLMHRASSLAMGEVIQFRLCRASARLQGFGSGEFHDFVALVPMADAEIVRLQWAGYAYLN
jgi:intracellular sulfur oxidation DsrE/DsrF family protein